MGMTRKGKIGSSSGNEPGTHKDVSSTAVMDKTRFPKNIILKNKPITAFSGSTQQEEGATTPPASSTSQETEEDTES